MHFYIRYIYINCTTTVVNQFSHLHLNAHAFKNLLADKGYNDMKQHRFQLSEDISNIMVLL